jgi:hypothetical protein
MSGIATAPEPQCMRALERANKVRLARAALKRRIADGEISAADVVLESPWEAQSMSIAELLVSQRRWGITRSRRFLAPIMLSENKAIGSLTDRQRRALAERLQEAQGRASTAARRSMN